MQLPSVLVTRGKTILHAVQALVIFIGWALTIAVFTKPGTTDGRTKYYFALCWFCIPALIYLSAVPAFERTKRFGNPYAYAGVDVLFAILWFAAFIAVAVWTNAGIHAGEAKDHPANVTGCALFAYGPESKCDISRATIVVGVIIFLLFLATSAISVYGVLYYRKNGSLPNTRPAVSDPSMEAQTTYAFSSNPNDEEDNENEISNSPPRLPEHNFDDDYALLHTNTEDGQHPGRPLSWGREDAEDLPSYHETDRYDTEYHGAGPYNSEPQSHLNQSGGDPFRDDLALSHDHGGYANPPRVDFPEADYHR